MSSPTSQFKNINYLALSLLYGPTLTSIHDWMKTIVLVFIWKTGKTIALTIWTFVSKVMTLLFNMLSSVLKCDVKKKEKKCDVEKFLFKAYGCMFYYSCEQTLLTSLMLGWRLGLKLGAGTDAEFYSLNCNLQIFRKLFLPCIQINSGLQQHHLKHIGVGRP